MTLIKGLKLVVVIVSSFSLVLFFSCNEKKKAEEINLEPVSVAELTEKKSESDLYDIFETLVDMVVTTDDGSKLNFRTAPVTGEKIGSFNCGVHVTVTRATKEQYTIDGITAPWYEVELDSVNRAWVFGGYLSPKSDYDNIIGEWENENVVVRIDSNPGKFFLGLKESEGFGGDWTLLSGNRLLVKHCYVYDEADAWDVLYDIIESDGIHLTLKRREDGFVTKLSKSWYYRQQNNH